ncbi:MAG: S1C family serine protease [Christensenellaceae bacterium]
MKRYFKITLLVVTMITVVTMLCSCGIVIGDNAYDLALKNGFSGTEQEWLESLKGEKGDDGLNGVNGKDGMNFNAGYTAKDLYNEAVAEGYDKDFLTFIKEIFGTDVNVNLQSGINRGLESSCNIFCYYQTTNGIYKSGGSGVFYNVDKENGNALIVTNYHVVYNSKATTKQMVYDDIYVFLYGDRYFQKPIKAKFIGGSSSYDVAVLKIVDSQEIKDGCVKACEFGDSADIGVGQNVIAIGNPSSNGTSVTRGVVSVVSESIDLEDAKDNLTRFRLIRIDAPINPGNSGGGLFDENGKVIGIINAKSIKENYENIGYAIPSNIVKLLVENIVRSCDGDNVYTIKKAYLGIQVLSSSSSAIFNESKNRYDVIEEVYVDSVADNSNVKELFVAGDKLEYVEYNEVKYVITANYVLGDLLINVKVGDKMKVGVLRNGQSVEVEINVTEDMLTDIE